jgi:hypothetical protein
MLIAGEPPVGVEIQPTLLIPSTTDEGLANDTGGYPSSGGCQEAVRFHWRRWKLSQSTEPESIADIETYLRAQFFAHRSFIEPKFRLVLKNKLTTLTETYSQAWQRRVWP